MTFGIAVTNLTEWAISLVSFEAFDEAFRRQQLPIPFPDSRVNMSGRTSFVGDRFNCSEIVFSIRTGQESTVTLEIRVECSLALRVLLQISSVFVALPDFDHGVAQWVSAGIQDPPTQMGNRADCRCDPIIDDQQIVIGIQRQLVRKERSFGGCRSPGQFFGK